MATICLARRLDDIYWSSSNPMFDISNTEHVKPVELLDRVTILCPKPTLFKQKYEYTKLYMVSREGYENCELKKEKQLGVCTTPERQSSISVVFRDFSPLSSSLHFKAGQSYYVITTSDGTYNGLNKTSGGLCQTSNMRMKFDVYKNYQNNDSELQSIDSNSLFSILPPNESTSPPILYIIHTVEPDTVSDSGLSLIFKGQRRNMKRQKYEDNNTNISSKSSSINRILFCLGILIVLNINFCRICLLTGY